ncbi:MAG: hypothetical protein AAGD18_15815 [Actinomycetota bacterium]
MPDLVLTTLLVVANVFGAGMIVPQLVRVRRTRNLNGLSLPWVGVGIALNVCWGAYAVGAQVWGVLPVSIAGTALYGAIAATAVPLHPAGVRAVAAGAAGATIAPAVGLAIGGWTTAGIAMGLSYGVQFAPAAFEAARAELVDGVSPTTWVMAAIEAAIWLVYGVEVADAALLIGGAGGLLMSILILGQLASTSPRLATR